MKILVENITEDGLEIVFPGDLDVLSLALEAGPAPGNAQIDPFVTGRARLVKTGEDFLFTATYRAKTWLECARCLTQFEFPVAVETSLILHPISTEYPTAEDLVESDPDHVLFHGPEIDLGRVILQEILLEVPMKPLCKPNCPGLCPQCGAQKGSEQCRCRDRDVIDPRWDALAALKDKITP
jgi:uncharacterized protein